MHQQIKTKTWSRIAFVNAVSFGLVIVLGVSYIAQINRSASHGYEMKALEERIAALKVENENRAFAVAEHQSVDTVTRKLKMLGMVPVDQVAYTSSATSAVAINR